MVRGIGWSSLVLQCWKSDQLLLFCNAPCICLSQQILLKLGTFDSSSALHDANGTSVPHSLHSLLAYRFSTPSLALPLPCSLLLSLPLCPPGYAPHHAHYQLLRLPLHRNPRGRLHAVQGAVQVGCAGGRGQDQRLRPHRGALAGGIAHWQQPCE